MSTLYHYTLIADGGAINNGRQEYGYSGRSYGSYKIITANGRERVQKLQFEDGDTNNVAEYKSLRAGLKDILELLHLGNVDPKSFNVHVIMDSQLVLYQTNLSPNLPQWRCNEAHLRVLRDEVRSLLGKFRGVKLEWVRREFVVGHLGH